MEGADEHCCICDIGGILLVCQCDYSLSGSAYHLFRVHSLGIRAFQLLCPGKWKENRVCAHTLPDQSSSWYGNWIDSYDSLLLCRRRFLFFGFVSIAPLSGRYCREGDWEQYGPAEERFVSTTIYHVSSQSMESPLQFLQTQGKGMPDHVAPISPLHCRWDSLPQNKDQLRRCVKRNRIQPIGSLFHVGGGIWWSADHHKLQAVDPPRDRQSL